MLCVLYRYCCVILYESPLHLSSVAVKHKVILSLKASDNQTVCGSLSKVVSGPFFHLFSTFSLTNQPNTTLHWGWLVCWICLPLRFLTVLSVSSVCNFMCHEKCLKTLRSVCSCMTPSVVQVSNKQVRCCTYLHVMFTDHWANCCTNQ